MKRKIILIRQDQCNGCGLCAKACHEGAIGIQDGKAVLLREDYCDGLGDCLPACPTGAITFEEREASAYNHQAVQAARQSKASPLSSGCPGTRTRQMERGEVDKANAPEGAPRSELSQWPIQLKLVPENAPYLDGADLLVAADCTAFAYGAIHRDFIRGKVTLIGCPKLDEGGYSEKLANIIKANAIQSVTVVRMEVPCCGGLEIAVKQAIQSSGKQIPCRTTVISVDGCLLF